MPSSAYTLTAWAQRPEDAQDAMGPERAGVLVPAGILMVDVENHRALTAPERGGNRAEPTDKRLMGDVSPA